jgi:hypothetical protein
MLLLLDKFVSLNVEMDNGVHLDGQCPYRFLKWCYYLKLLTIGYVISRIKRQVIKILTGKNDMDACPFQLFNVVKSQRFTSKGNNIISLQSVNVTMLKNLNIAKIFRQNRGEVATICLWILRKLESIIAVYIFEIYRYYQYTIWPYGHMATIKKRCAPLSGARLLFFCAYGEIRIGKY